MRIRNLFHTLQGEIFVCTFLSAVIAVAIGTGLVYRQATTIIKRQAILYATGDIEGIDTSLLQTFENARNVALKIAINPDVVDACRTIYGSASYDEFDQYKQIVSFLKTVMANEPMIDEVVIYRNDGSNFHSGETFIPRSQMSGLDTSSDADHGLSIIHADDGTTELYIIRRIMYMKQSIGIIYVKLNQKQLASLYEKISIPEITLCSFDSQGNLLSGNEKGRELVRNGSIKIQQLSLLGSASLTSILGQRMFVLSKIDNLYGVRTISLIPYRILVRDSMRVQRLVIVIIIICMTLSFALSWFFSVYLSRDLGKLRLTMLKIRHGNLHVSVEHTYSTEEVSDLAEIFDAMMHSINELMDKNIEVEKKRKEIEKEYLRLQIQPHFIYGTINSMQYLAHLHGETELEQVATALVELLRAVLGNDEQFVPISQEKYYIEQYLIIQRCKFRKDFGVNWDISPDLLSHPIPKLILQPIVENALVHGIIDKEDGRIIIKVEKREDKIICNVTDNGIGISPGKVVSIKKGYVFRTIALRNVFDRIQLLYGDDGDAMISSIPSKGTSVTLVMPL
ncbi:MAG: histidine kinase [Sphaerochaetaceae bacterium]